MSLQSIVKPASLTGSLFRCSAIGVSARSLSTKVIAPSSYTTSISRCSTLLPQSTSTSLSSQSRSFSRSIPSLSKDTTWLNKGENVSYSELKPETEAPSGKITLIDVREPDEVSQGMIPSSVNVPLTRFQEAFDSNKGSNFSKEFAFDRPSFDDRIVFYCRSGKRSQQAMEVARKNGWWNTRNYSGSYLDWVQQEEARSKK